MRISPAIPSIGIDRRLKPKAGMPLTPATRTLRRVLKQARPLWPHLVGVLLLTLVSTPFALLLPLPLKMVVDSVISHRPAPAILTRLLPASWNNTPGLLMIAAIALLAIGALMQIQVLLSWMLQTYTGERLVHDFRSRLFWHVQRLRLSFHDRRGTADLAYRIQHDAPAIQLVTIQGVIPFVTSALSFIGMAYVTARLDWQLAVIAFMVSPALILLSRAASSKTHEGWHEVKELDSSAMSVLTEVLGSVRLVKSFGREQDEDARFNSRSSLRMNSQLRLAAIQATFYCATAMLITLGTAATLWVGAKHVQTGVLTLGELLIVMAYMTQLYEPLRVMANKLPELQASLVSIERAFTLLDEVPESLDLPTARPLNRAVGHIEFRKVSFVYPTGRSVLQNVSVTINPGTRVGILGPTGSGKSTLLSLLTRFYDPAQGEILLDGVNIREYRLSDLRQQFAIVPQDPVLFSTSIADNIAFARQGLDEREVIEAAKLAHAHDFIMQLPEGYRTEVGDRGNCLSGGERQRIAIARAFLKDSPMLILDEPTSAVDCHTESLVMRATDELLAGRTSFMIAHRLSTLEHCDMLLRFYDGKLEVITQDVKEFLRHLAATDTGFSVEELTHSELRSQTAFFAEHANGVM